MGDERVAIEKFLGLPVQLAQSPTELSKWGWHHFAAKYADAFGLSTSHLYALLDFIRYWDVLRQCCGAQMSDDWRAALEGRNVTDPEPAVDSPGYSACTMYDLDAVESLLMGTEVYRRFGAHAKRIRSLSTWDGDFTGKYCSNENEKIARHEPHASRGCKACK